MTPSNDIGCGLRGATTCGRDRIFDEILKRVKSQRVRANLDAFIRSLAEDDSDALSARDENSNERICSERTSQERERLENLVEHSSEIFLLDGRDLDRIAMLSCRRVSHRCGPRAKGSCFLKPRNFALRKKLIRRLRAEYRLMGSVPNPYYFGCYYCIVEALAILGVNQYHAFNMLRREVEESMGSTRWRIFAHREGSRHRPRIVEDAERDANARLQYNCRVLQRTKNYGLKLLQVGQIIMKTKGCVIDIIDRAGQMMYRLNTDAAEPLYEPAAGRRKRRPLTQRCCPQICPRARVLNRN